MRADHAVGGCKAGEGDAGGVRGPTRGEGDGFQRGKRALVGTIVIHDPEFLVPGARADERNLRGGDAGEAAGEFIDNLIGELMGEFADLQIRRLTAIDFADDGFVGAAANIVKPGGDDDFAGGFGEIAECDEIGVEGRFGPDEELEFLRLGRNLGGVKAGRDEFDDAGKGEIFSNHRGEEGGVGGGSVGAGGEISDGDAGELRVAEAGAGAEPVLGQGCGGEE